MKEVKINIDIPAIDFHCHYGTEKSGFYSNFKLLRKQMIMSNIEMAVIFPLAGSDKSLFYRRSNKLVAKIANRYPKQFIGFMRIPLQKNNRRIKKEIEKNLNLGLRGIKIHPPEDKIKLNTNSITEVAEIAEKYDLPILTHVGHKNDFFVSPETIIDIAKTFPKVKFIGAHSRGLEKTAKALKDLKNFYIDTSCILNHSTFMYFIYYGNSKRILFGSDFPLSLPLIERLKIEFCKKNLGYPQKKGLLKKDKIRVFRQNAIDLLKID